MNRIIPYLTLGLLLFLNACGTNLDYENKILRDHLIAVND